MAYPARQCGVAVAMDDGGPLLTPVLANADKNRLLFLSRTGPTWWPVPAPNQLKPRVQQPALHPIQPGMYGRRSLWMPSCRRHRRHPGCGGSRRLRGGASDASISVKRQMQVELKPPTTGSNLWHPRRGLSSRILPALIETDPESLASDVSAAPEDGDLQPRTVPTSPATTSICLSRSHCPAAGGKPRHASAPWRSSPDGSARHLQVLGSAGELEPGDLPGG